MVVEGYVAGIDGGATKTIALIGTRTRIIGRGESGSANYQNIGPLAACKAIRSAVGRAAKQAGLPKGSVETAVVALAGVDSAEGIRITRRFVRGARISNRVFVIHDSVAALYAATHGRPGLIVNSGTGSFAAGMNESGDYVRVGGWGYLIGDEGSAFDIGMKAIRLGFRMIDGRTPPARLITLLKRSFGVRTFDGILDGISSGRIGVEEIAQLAARIAKAANHDMACRQILREAGTSLAEQACTAAKRLKMTRRVFPLAMMGGGFGSGRYFADPFIRTVKRECPRAHPEKLQEEPAKGAYLIATKLAAHGTKALPYADLWLRMVVN